MDFCRVDRNPLMFSSSRMEEGGYLEEEQEEYFEEDSYPINQVEEEMEYYHHPEVEVVLKEQQQQQQQQQTHHHQAQFRQKTQRKQHIERLASDDQFNIVTKEEYKVEEVGRRRSSVMKAMLEKKNLSIGPKDKFYILKPEDFKKNPSSSVPAHHHHHHQFKQGQIQRAILGHPPPQAQVQQKKSLEMLRVQQDNARLRDLVEMYKQRESKIRLACSCQQVHKILDNNSSNNDIKVTASSSGTNNVERITVVVGDNNSKQSSKRPITITNMKTATTGFKPGLSRFYVGSKFSNSQEITITPITSSTPTPPTVTARTSNAINLPPNITCMPISTSTSVSSKPTNSLTITTTAQERPIVKNIQVNSPLAISKAVSTLTDWRKMNIVSKTKPVPALRMIKPLLPAPLPSYVPIIDNTQMRLIAGKPRRKFKAVKNPLPKVIKVKKEVPPAIRLQNTVNLLRRILPKYAKGGHQMMDLTEKGSELAYWADEVVPLKMLIRKMKVKVEPGPPTPPQQVNDEVTTRPSSVTPPDKAESSPSQRRSKRSAAMTRLSTADLLSGKKANKSLTSANAKQVSNSSSSSSPPVEPAVVQMASKLPLRAAPPPPPPQAVMVEEVMEEEELLDDLDRIDWDTYELQYVRPNISSLKIN